MEPGGKTAPKTEPERNSLDILEFVQEGDEFERKHGGFLSRYSVLTSDTKNNFAFQQRLSSGRIDV